MPTILSIGNFSKRSNTSLHRHWALESLASRVDGINTHKKPLALLYRIRNRLFLIGFPISLPDNSGVNKDICRKISERKYDIVWIDKGITIHPGTLRYIKKTSPETRIISYSPDNMTMRHNQSQNYLQCIPLYDYLFTTKSYTLDSMQALGAKAVFFCNNCYESTYHYPYALTEEEKIRFGADVGFIGCWEKERCQSILYLADHGVRVRVFGDKKWLKYKRYSPNLTIEEHSLFSEEYCKALQAFKISLCFLRKMNLDQQTTRSMEIPACNGFMLGERSPEHLALFKEGIEAEFFSSHEEMLKKCLYYLAHEDKRQRIVEAGRKKCLDAGYSNTVNIRNLLNLVLPNTVCQSSRLPLFPGEV